MSEPTQNEKIKKERSAAYPSIPLDQAIDFSAKLQKAFGKSQFSREHAVKEMGYATVTGTSGKRVGDLVHYGLLQREGNAYRNSDLSMKISNPLSDIELDDSKKKAANSPKLFKKLINEYNGSAIPTALDSILVRNYAISRKVSDNVAKVFRKTAEFAGLYTNGIIMITPDIEVVQQVADEKKTEATVPTPTQKPETPPKLNSLDMNSVELPSGIIIFYPKRLAYHFAIGSFGKEIAALEGEVKKVSGTASENQKI